VQADINRELERRFPPEFRNRIDQVVVFEPLTKDEVREITLKYLDEVSTSLKRWNKQIHVEPEAVEKLVTDGYSPAYGARFLKRVVDDQIKLPLSQHWKDSKSLPRLAQGWPGGRRSGGPATGRGVGVRSDRGRGQLLTS
jgi:ATP-dependent Clp protease ATP-binding subunit ClpA